MCIERINSIILLIKCIFVSPGCTATAPDNGKVDDGSTSSVLDGNTVAFTCDTGYTLSSSGIVTCTSGSLEAVPTCKQGMFCLIYLIKLLQWSYDDYVSIKPSLVVCQ